MFSRVEKKSQHMMASLDELSKDDCLVGFKEKKKRHKNSNAIENTAEEAGTSIDLSAPNGSEDLLSPRKEDR